MIILLVMTLMLIAFALHAHHRAQAASPRRPAESGSGGADVIIDPASCDSGGGDDGGSGCGGGCGGCGS